MTVVRDLHEWDLTPLEARQLQEKLAGQVSLCPMRKKTRFVAGLDCALNKHSSEIYAAAVVFSYKLSGIASRAAKAMGERLEPCLSPPTRRHATQDPLPELKLIETATAQLPLVFPYVPGLLSFREIPVYLEAVKKLQTPVDIWLIDGQGIAHPRRLGLASHLGLFLKTPTIGCAKSRLTGTFDEPGKNKGDFSWLYDRNEKIGAVLRTRDDVKPLFVSPGHLCSFKNAIELTLACTTRYRLPEPTRIAHQLVTAACRTAAGAGS